MVLTPTEIVRLKTSDQKVLTRETAKGDGESTFFKVSHSPIIGEPEVKVDGLPVTPNSITADQGVIVLSVAPVVGKSVEFIYYWAFFTDDEIAQFLAESNNNTNIASAKLLLAWAADTSRLAKRVSLTGGGAAGQATNDTSLAAREFRATAQALLDLERELGTDGSITEPAEAFSEPIWTERDFETAVYQHIVRNA